MSQPTCLTFTVPLGLSAHQLARQFFDMQPLCRRKQVYLNTLAIYAVRFYLKCMGIKADWETSDSYDPLMQLVMDTADLEIPHLGSLECRPVLPDAQVVEVPPSAWSERIGYVAVQLDESLRKATLLGFLESVTMEEIPISQLRSLKELRKHLLRLSQPEPIKTRANLSMWLENTFEPSWQSLEAILGPGQKILSLGLRSGSQASAGSVKRAKVINLKLQLLSQAVALLVAIAEQNEQEMGILVQVHPVGEENLLPPNIRLALLLESGEILQSVQSRSLDNFIQLIFSGQPGESFSILVALDDASVTENFYI